MIQSDTLSRRPDHGKEVEQDNKNMILLPDNLFVNLLEYDMINPTKALDMNDNNNNDDVHDAIKSLSIHGLKTLHNHFSNNTTAISVNDIIINVMDMDLQKQIATAQCYNFLTSFPLFLYPPIYFPYPRNPFSICILLGSVI